MDIFVKNQTELNLLLSLKNMNVRKKLKSINVKIISDSEYKLRAGDYVFNKIGDYVAFPIQIT